MPTKRIMVRCPECGHNISEVIYLDGVVLLSLKCRYCKNYIKVEIRSIPEE